MTIAKDRQEEEGSIVDVDAIPLSEIELSPEELEDGRYSEEGIPAEDNYDNGDSKV